MCCMLRGSRDFVSGWRMSGRVTLRMSAATYARPARKTMRRATSPATSSIDTPVLKDHWGLFEGLLLGRLGLEGSPVEGAPTNPVTI